VDIRRGYSQLRHRVPIPFTMLFFGFGLWPWIPIRLTAKFALIGKKIIFCILLTLYMYAHRWCMDLACCWVSNQAQNNWFFTLPNKSQATCVAYFPDNINEKGVLVILNHLLFLLMHKFLCNLFILTDSRLELWLLVEKVQ
jgi:hypothetical protein